MQSYEASPILSMDTASRDSILLSIKRGLESSYWQDNQGVYAFRFNTGNQPLTNNTGVLSFNIIRYTPSFFHDASALQIPGRMENGGTFIYGGGLRGMLQGDTIKWIDHNTWSRVLNVSAPSSGLLNLRNIREQARLDSQIVGTIMDKYYDLSPQFTNPDLYK